MRKSLIFAYPGDLDLKTGGYGYDRQVIEGLRATGWDVSLLPLGDGFPAPVAEVLREAVRRLSALPDNSLVVVDGLAFGVMDDWATDAAERLKIVALVHHPLALETGLTPDEQELLRQRETRALSGTRHVIVTSPMTAREISENYGVAESDITVALPGTNKTTRPRQKGENPHILSIGSLTRRKGHDVLIDALKTIENIPWQATIIGSRDLDPQTATALEKQVHALELESRITFEGEIDDPAEAYASADIFALASRYEGYGMVFAEALAHGLPIVACHAGAVPDVVPDDAGILVPVDDVAELGSALRLLLTDADERERRAEAATRAGLNLPTWNNTSEIISNTLRKLI